MEDLTGSNNPSDFSIAVSSVKWFLRKALLIGCLKYSECKRIVLSAFAYLAVLHLATSEYQAAKESRLFLSIITEQTHGRHNESLNVVCLLFSDDIARIVGLCVLNKKIILKPIFSRAYINRRLYLDLRLSPDVFVHYLTVLSAQRTSTHANFNQDLPDSLFLMDEYLKTVMKSKCIASTKSDACLNDGRQIAYRRRDSLPEDESTIAKHVMDKDTVMNNLMA